MFKKSFFLLALFTSVLKADVEIEYAGNVIRYDINPRLSAVLNRLVLGTDFYWHNSSLYALDDKTANNHKSDVIALLQQIKSKTGVATSKMQTLVSLQEEVEKWQVATRLPLNLDYDLIRIREELNPRLSDGRYRLHLPFRVYTVNVVGAISQTKKLAHQSMSHVRDYLQADSIEYLPYADKTFVFVIHPNGQTKKVSLGFENIEHVEVPPGGTIYIPIKELPFSSENEQLNISIAQLLGSKIN
ncbi:capsule biosynthesis GfcC family protein [Planctobacterium marinum]|uniref:Capsule biosynthesis GfcC-like C-terminal domain-containing protein n=1 Tax=Planctobacterium marinum TaxID=1631968 RepID=A0AA48HTW8_9ALTE|nr:hypothetical protein MACH26_00310 [Planctobacterium marinum]